MKKIYKMLITVIFTIFMLFTSVSIPKTNVFTSSYTQTTSSNIITIDKKEDVLPTLDKFNLNKLDLSSKYTIPLSNNYYVSIPANFGSANILQDLPEVIDEVSESNIPEEVEEPEETHEEIIKRLVHDVDTGKAGNGKDRKEYLGEYYDEVQKIIDEKYKSIPKKTSSPKSSSSNTVTQAKSDLQQYAHDLLIEKGFSEGDFTCLVKLWNRESGWNPNAHNKSSGAHGIPQALPASKMASYGSDYYTNGYTQIKWGIDYIINRYGSPTNAWNHFQNKGWY